MISLNCENFAGYYIFNTDSPTLSEQDKIIAKIANALIALSLGVGHLICYLFFYNKDYLSVSATKTNSLGPSTINNLNKINSKESQKNYEDVYFVRFLNIQTSNPAFEDFKKAVKEDLKDYNSNYQKGSCLYTPSSVQPLVDKSDSRIAIAYPFAFLINPNVPLHYWSIQDMDRNSNRTLHEDAKKNKKEKYKPQEDTYHNVCAEWKTIHFTKLESFIEKIKSLANAVNTGKNIYKTKGNKDKPLNNITQHHNEGCISYNPEKDVVGILIENKNSNIDRANYFKKNYVDDKGNLPFKDAFLAYRDIKGKITKI